MLRRERDAIGFYVSGHPLDEHRGVFSVTRMCKALNVSPSGYYAWLKRPVSAREMANRKLVKEIEAVYNDNYETYGSPRVYRELRIV